MSRRASNFPPSTRAGATGATERRPLVPHTSSSRKPKDTLKMRLSKTNITLKPAIFCSRDENSSRPPVRLRSCNFNSSSLKGSPSEAASRSASNMMTLIACSSVHCAGSVSSSMVALGSQLVRDGKFVARRDDLRVDAGRVTHTFLAEVAEVGLVEQQQLLHVGS